MGNKIINLKRLELGNGDVVHFSCYLRLANIQQIIVLMFNSTTNAFSFFSSFCDTPLFAFALLLAMNRDLPIYQKYSVETNNQLLSLSAKEIESGEMYLVTMKLNTGRIFNPGQTASSSRTADSTLISTGSAKSQKTKESIASSATKVDDDEDDVDDDDDDISEIEEPKHILAVADDQSGRKNIPSMCKKLMKSKNSPLT